MFLHLLTIQNRARDLKTIKARENEFKDFVVDNGSIMNGTDQYSSMKPINRVSKKKKTKKFLFIHKY